jgi:hypothetical protein
MKFSRLAKSIALTSIVMLSGTSFTALSSNNATKISATMSSVYNNKFDEADLIASKLSDIRVATMAFWTANQAWPSTLNDIITSSFYFSSFNTTTGYSISGGEGINSYYLQINVDNVEVGKYLANKVNGIYNAGVMVLQYNLPVSSIQNSVSLARYDNPDDINASTMFTDLDMGSNDIFNVGSIVAQGDLTIVSALGTNTLLISDSAFQLNGDDIITAGNISDYIGDSDTSDSVSKTIDSTMRAIYTIDGQEADSTPSGASLNFINNAKMSFIDPTTTIEFSQNVGVFSLNVTDPNLSASPFPVLETGPGGYIKLNHGSTSNDAQRLITTSDGIELYRGWRKLLTVSLSELRFGELSNSTTSSVNLKAHKRGGVYSRLLLNGNAILKSVGGNVLIGHSDSRITVDDGGASKNIQLSSLDTISMSVGKKGNRGGFFLTGLNDDFAKAYVSLQFESDQKLRTIATGVEVTGGMSIVNSATLAEYFNVSESALIYQGANVITTANLGAQIIDADTLDGLDSTVFLRNDITTPQTVAGDLGVAGKLNLNDFGTIESKYLGPYKITDIQTSSLNSSSITGNTYANNTHLVSDFVSKNQVKVNHVNGASANFSAEVTSDIANVSLYASGARLQLINDYTNDYRSLVANVDEVTFGSRTNTFPITMNFIDNTFKVNGFDVITADNISSYVSTDADTLDGLDSSQFARLDQVNTFSGRLSLEDGATIKGAISLVNSSDVEYASITDADITFSGANVWATSAQLTVAGISVGTINATSVTADTVNANTTLAVNGVDVGLWISNCEAGTSPGCSL